MAFRVFLFLVPYAFVVVTLLGYTETTSSPPTSAFASDTGVGGLMLTAVSGSTHLSTLQRLIALIGGAVALVWTARALLKVLRVTHALIWRVPVPRTARVQPAVILIGLVTLGLCLSAILSKVEAQSIIVAIATAPVFIAIPGAFWLLVSIYLPHRPVPWWALLPGAIVVALGVEALHLVTAYWLPIVIKHKSVTYGALASALALLVWAALAGRLLTSSPVINATLWGRGERRLAHYQDQEEHHAEHGDGAAAGDQPFVPPTEEQAQ